MTVTLISLGLQIHTAERHIKDYYERTHFTITSEFEDWPPYRPKCFVNIALVQHKHIERSKHERMEVTNARNVGAFGTISKKVEKRRLSLGDIIKPHSLKAAEEFLKHNSITKNLVDIFHSTNAKTILIEGAASIGKTYLCKEIAYQWSQGQLLAEKKLLFLLFLSEQRVQSISSVKDLVACSCQHEKDENIELIAHYLQDTAGESLTLLLDGYNKVSEKLPYDHFINRIVHVLPKCMIVITSQSFAFGSLYHLAECRFEILGFTNNDRQEYITQALKDSPSEIAKVKQYFNDNLTISSLCYIPLNMAIFLYLFKQNDCPNSCTELYKKFVESTIQYHLMKGGYSCEKQCKTLTDIIILNLAQFSYNHLCKEQLVFNFDEITKVCPEIFETQFSEAIHGLGLLQITGHFSTEGPKKSFTFNFTHSSIQDYLAALYIKSLPDDKQMNLLKDTFWNEKYMNTWIMFMGLTEGKTIAFKKFLSGNLSITDDAQYPHKIISPEIMCDKLKCLHLFQCFKEANDTEMYKKVGESLENDQIDLSWKTLLPKHVITLAFFLVQSCKHTSSWVQLDLSNCNMHDITCSLLLRALNCQEAKISIKFIDLSCNELTAKSAGTLASLVEECRTEKLDITCNQLGDKGAECFSTCLVGNTTLRLLMMDGNYITSRVADKIESGMINKTSLQVIGTTSHQLCMKSECGSNIISLLQHYLNLTCHTAQ